MKQSKFVLGTANLGTTYGINNQDTYDRIASAGILKHATARGISTLDTAAEYGIAENLIGESFGSNENLRLITKIPTRELYTYEYIRECLDGSLRRLQQKKIYGLMFHDPDIHKKNEICDISKRLLDSGQVENIGFSAYSLAAVLEAKNKNQHWTIFQVPENILDQRLRKSTELVDLTNARNSVFVRSIFLQGLILQNPNELPHKFQKYKRVFQELQNVGQKMGVSALDLCLSYSSSIAWNSGSIIAAASIKQLDQILDFKFLDLDFDNIETLTEEILDPRKWNELN